MESALEIVKKFYESAGILNKAYCQEIFHENVQLEWYSSKGYLFLEHADLLALSKDLKLSYFDLRAQVHDIMCDDDKVMIRYTYYVRTFENSEEEMVLATFFAVWEIKDGKFFKGIQMSQLSN
ncbi:nuclear transport factor 2 family protein [Flavobacterium sp. xlx-214]|uniref:nuclear transport factor 2 family protein n=1 Tax=unclassified Flavobacterium TaxID=196869 RepID=UPI0013D24291|nr:MULTISPECIES: nuclear transport factor 2 family protein [unclassified Flavobacterium]MBA5791480.1 nuclear transport factor 2 family protein [Flavobacterium sp. xlx-221]QMI83370.1 nuclear transport factor 2 family protein [Flavobacterium sp. xlx-214]